MARPESEEWLRFARDDLETAEFLCRMSVRKIEIICYHCQQSAEKAIKAVLSFHDDEIPRSHDLGFLLKSALHRDSRFSRFIGHISRLQPYAVSVRYPYEIHVEAGDEDRAIQDAQEILGAAFEACRG